MHNTLLLADDDVELTGLLQEYFESEGFEVRLAHDGLEALEELRKPGLDLVVLDVMMPEMNGMDVLQELRRESRLPVIMLTARLPAGSRGLRRFLRQGRLDRRLPQQGLGMALRLDGIPGRLSPEFRCIKKRRTSVRLFFYNGCPGTLNDGADWPCKTPCCWRTTTSSCRAC
jgi:CheY-like chemotaxis protein